MTLQNRVTPTGEIIVHPARGTLMGNRGGAFHRADRTLGRSRWASRQWICCELSFKDRRRSIMAPGLYTELFFLDEVTALAAGHRPCFECRRSAAQWFQALWCESAQHHKLPLADEMDRQLHKERLSENGGKGCFGAPLAALPPSTAVLIADQPCVIIGQGRDVCRLAAWSPGGYQPDGLDQPRGMVVQVLTPATIVAILQRGYEPMRHLTWPS
jgi:hypothetical protein